MSTHSADHRGASPPGSDNDDYPFISSPARSAPRSRSRSPPDRSGEASFRSPPSPRSGRSSGHAGKEDRTPQSQTAGSLERNSPRDGSPSQREGRSTGQETPQGQDAPEAGPPRPSASTRGGHGAGRTSIRGRSGRGRGGRGSGRPKFDLVSNGYVKEVSADDQVLGVDDNGQFNGQVEAVQKKGFACAYEGCSFTQFPGNEKLPTSRFIEHFALKCSKINEEALEMLDSLTNGAVTTKRHGKERATSTVVLQPIQAGIPQGSRRPPLMGYQQGVPVPAGNGRHGEQSLHRVASTRSAAGAAHIAEQHDFGSSGAARDDPAEHVPAGPMLRFVDTMTAPQAIQINKAITRFIVGCALPFQLVANPYFIDLLRTLRPAFIEQKKLYSPAWYARTGLADLYADVKDNIGKLFGSLILFTYLTLSGDGFKTEAGHKVVNFTEQASTKVAFRTSVAVELARENVDFYIAHFKDQLSTRPLSTWCSVVGDNVVYMKQAFEKLSLEFPTIFFYGCVAHLLDLLCEDYADLLLKQIVDQIKDIVVFVTSHSRVKELFLKMKGRHGIGLRTFPDTRFSYAALMIFSVLSNRRSLKRCLCEDNWDDCVTNSDGSDVSGRLAFEASIEDADMWKQAQEAYDLLNPVAVALRYIEGNAPRISFVYILMMSLYRDVIDWEPRYLIRGIAARAKQTFEERWRGSRQGNTRRVNVVPLFNPLHMVAFYLDPYISFTAQDMALPENLAGFAENVFRKFCETDNECIQVRQEFEAFCAGTGEYGTRKLRAANDAKAACAELLADHLKENDCTESSLSRTQKAVLQCLAASGNRDNAVTWWINNCRHAKLKEIAIRVLSCCPTAAVVERMNSMHKLVQTKTRAALKHERVVQLLYCYVNMRLLDGVEEDLLNMVEEALHLEIQREEQEMIRRAEEANGGEASGAGAGASAARPGSGARPESTARDGTAGPARPADGPSSSGGARRPPAASSSRH